jgi:hypothetical protein
MATGTRRDEMVAFANNRLRNKAFAGTESVPLTDVAPQQAPTRRHLDHETAGATSPCLEGRRHLAWSESQSLPSCRREI